MKTDTTKLDPQQVLNQFALEYMRDQKAKRRWRWVYRGVILLIIIFLVYSFFANRAQDIATSTKPHVGLIDIKGNLFFDQDHNADDFMKSMVKAYKHKGLKALILRIDSPGGSPVQADYMYNSIDYFHKKHSDVKIYAVCVDICASAAYYVASAADEIYANPASLVGSIGVLYNGFGAVDAMQKLGISRRVQTAGVNKAFLDPFLPEVPEQVNKMQAMLDLVHQQFIDRVKKGRGARLHINQDTFSGLIWTGVQAKEQGLIDGFGSAGQLARDVIKIDTVIDYSSKPTVWQQMSKTVGTTMANQLPMVLGLKPGIQ